ncbi:MAG: hypothetical protein K9N35_09400 [Candidatus Marinimicrobia bacterium]|nr:hypothetical protein [Candidatus Neomarinimicrobiota bacterium]
MDCKVLNVGVNDLGSGEAFLKTLEKRAEFPFISSNIALANTGKLAFQPSLIIKSNDLKLGFVGVTIGNPRIKEFTYNDPVESVKKAVSDLKGKVDLVFLLANVDDDVEKLLTQEVKGADFLIRSKSRGLYRVPKDENGMIVIRNGIQGKYAGVLKIKKHDENEHMTDLSSQYARIKFTENRLQSMSVNLKEGETLEAHYADDATRLNLIKKLQAEKKANEEAVIDQKNSYYYEPIALNAKIPDSEEIASIVKDFMPEDSKK